MYVTDGDKTRNNGVRSTSGVRMGALTPWFTTLPKSSIRQTMTNIDIENNVCHLEV